MTPPSSDNLSADEYRSIPPDELAAYRASAKCRLQRKQQALAQRRSHALDLAREAAQLLKQEFGATRVVLFGSLARNRGFHTHSDVDLCAWELEESRYLVIVARLLDLDPSIDVNLVIPEAASPSLLRAIDQEGTPL